MVRSGDYKDCEDAAIVVIAIGEARKPGQTRLDMLGRSVEMLKELLAQLSPYKISGIVVTITNPADIVADFVRKGLGHSVKNPVYQGIPFRLFHLESMEILL